MKDYNDIVKCCGFFFFFLTSSDFYFASLLKIEDESYVLAHST